MDYQIMKEIRLMKTTYEIMKLRRKVSIMSYISESIALIRTPHPRVGEE